MTVKERLHALVEDLPEGEAEAAVRFLESLRQDTPDPVARSLRDAPIDDEPLTAEDLVALEEAERDRQEGRVVPDAEARQRFLRGA